VQIPPPSGEAQSWARCLFQGSEPALHEQGIKVSRGTIVDASIISAPSSTKNKVGRRSGDASDGQGKQWYFAMKAHIGVDSKEKIIHTVKVSAANVAFPGAAALLHGKETRVYGDQAYRGQGDVIRKRARRRRTSSISATATTVRSMRLSGSEPDQVEDPLPS